VTLDSFIAIVGRLELTDDVRQLSAALRRIDQALLAAGGPLETWPPEIQHAYRVYHADLEHLWRVVMITMRQAGATIADVAAARRQGYTWLGIRQMLESFAHDRREADREVGRKTRTTNKANAKLMRGAKAKTDSDRDRRLRAEAAKYRAKHPATPTRQMALALAKTTGRKFETVRSRLNKLSIK
jgi:hypothetical protein